MSGMSGTVLSTLHYFNPPKDSSRPWQSVEVDLATGERPSNFEREPHEIQIENIRGKENIYSLDASGFQYFTHSSAHKTFADDEEITKEYYPESEALLKKLTGANRIVIFDHTIRRHRPGQVDTSEHTRQPVTLVHVDQTPESAERRVHMHVPELAPELLKHRYQIINLWRPISHPAYDFPLALCDYRSINWDQDLVPTTLRFAHREGETFSVKYNPEHKWKYVRGMRPEEGVLIKCFDSKMDGTVAVLTPHTAFIDPMTPKDAPYRESIELRALVFYDNLPNGM